MFADPMTESPSVIAKKKSNLKYFLVKLAHCKLLNTECVTDLD